MVVSSCGLCWRGNSSGVCGGGEATLRACAGYLGGLSSGAGFFGFASPAQLRAGLAGILNHLEGFCLTGAMRFGPPRRPRHVMMRRPERGLCWSAFDVSSQLGADPAVAQSASGRPVAPATLMRRPEGGLYWSDFDASR